MSENDEQKTETMAQPVTTDASQAKDTVEGLPLPTSDNVSDNPGQSPSDVNKETSSGRLSESTAGSVSDTPDTDKEND